MSKYGDVPKSDKNLFQESDEKIMHATLPISNENMLNGSDFISTKILEVCIREIKAYTK